MATRPEPLAAGGDGAQGATHGRPARAMMLGSISGRILFLSAVWILLLLGLGGFALDRVLTGTIQRNFDAQLAQSLPAMLAAAELDPYGEVRFNRQPVDPRFHEPYSGLYWQVNAEGHEAFRSRSLWDRELPFDADRSCVAECMSRSEGFSNEPVRIIERDGIIPGSPVVWRFQVAQATAPIDGQIADVRRTLWLALGALGAGLFLLAILQASFGLLPLKRMSAAIADIRIGRARRAPADDVPPEIAPLVAELNGLLDHNERAAEAARMHAGNLAHALKTPMSVLVNEAQLNSPDLAQSVVRELGTMRRHIDHHLARARAAGRRTDSTARTEVWPSLERLRRAIERIHDGRVTIDLAGMRTLSFRGEQQDFEEIVGNLIDNAAKYGGGRVFVTVEDDAGDGMICLLVEDDGPGIPPAERARLFERGVRLDIEKPGTGLGLAIARDVAEIYGGSVALGDSEDLGGLLVTVRLPACPPRADGAPVRPAPA